MVDSQPDDRASADELLERLAAIAHELVESNSVDETLQRIVDTATTLLSTCDDSSTTFVTRQGLTTPAATSSTAYALDRRQQDAGEGPCVSALANDPTTIVSDIATDDRWPGWRDAALDAGYRSMLGLRLFVDGDTMGALNLYSETPGALTGRPLQVARIFASHSSVALKAAINEAGLERALASRDTIGQAKGILMERDRLSGEQAFDRLNGLAQERGVPLREVAAEITETGDVEV